MTIVGIPKEIKDHESRVAVTPAGVDLLVRNGHDIRIETGAGEGSSISDEAYAKAGAKLVSRDEVFDASELLLKVKEPQPSEIDLLRADQTLFTFFHFAADESLTRAMCDRGTTCIAYETVQTPEGNLPLLAPMSDVAGRVAVSAAIKFLERPAGGKGKLISGIPGVRGARIMILGGGTVGTAAARACADLGAEVFIFDTNLQRLKFLFETLPGNVHPLASNPYAIREALPQCDVIIGAVLIPGGRAPTLISDEMLDLLEPRSLLIDVAVDQGGCIETIHPTTHSDPVYLHKGILHYGVSNMPGAVPQTSTWGLTNATLPYALALANKGWRKAMSEDKALLKGLNISGGLIYHPGVAAAFGLKLNRLEP